jgi:hypothetical protein
MREILHHSHRCGLLILLLVLTSQLGCVRRRMTIVSNPPGAVVYVDERRIGVTPVSTSFTYYGTRSIRLVKDGFETVCEDHKFSTPWYQYVGLDFVSENLWPSEIRDERVLNFQLSPQQSIPPATVMQRAEQLRSETQQGLMTPVAPTGHHLLHQ